MCSRHPETAQGVDAPNQLIMYLDDCNRIRVCGRLLVAPRAVPILTQAKVWNV